MRGDLPLPHGRHGAAVPAVPVRDTVKRVENGVVVETPDRASLRAVQTPQCFQRNVIQAAMMDAVKNAPDITDDWRVSVAGGIHEQAAVYADENAAVIVPREDAGEVKASVQLPPFLYAPLSRGTVVGKIVYSVNGKELGEIPLLCADNIAYNGRKRGFFEYISDILIL